MQDWNSVQAYFQYGLDVPNRRVFLLGDIEESEDVVKGIYYLSSLSPKEPIELFVGSFGGDTYDMFGLYDVLHSVPNPISTVAMGKCMSAAPLLVAAGTVGSRYSMPNTSWMVHLGEVSGPDSFRTDAALRTLEHFKDLDSRWYDLMARHTRKTAKQWRQICAHPGDSYFSAEKAVEYGLVDMIWSEKE